MALDAYDELPSTPTSANSASGLPDSYYERYTRKYNLSERQRQREDEERRRREAEMAKLRALYAEGKSNAGASSVTTSDHLEAAVENLYKMVERKVSYEQTPRPSNAAAASLNRGLRPPSWTSTAIHSEVSKLYHMGAATAPPPPVEGLKPIDESTVGASTVSSFWRNAGRALEDGTLLRTSSRKSNKSLTNAGGGGVPCDLLLFVYGFLLPPLWWIGACRSEPTKWRRWCRIMSVVGTLVYVVIVVVLVWLFILR
ncbi:hypothetical protein HDU85_005351 [Gaertneriomyces sp. JEL0708]|nr:hypothetical protein HDU85_005351 [Gaertneriomyces sp. JEL0708]